MCLYRCCVAEKNELDFDYCGKDVWMSHLACKQSQAFDSANCQSNAKLLRIDNSLARYIIREHNVARWHQKINVMIVW